MTTEGIPYTLAEAEEILESPAHRAMMDVYHVEMMRWLVEQLRAAVAEVERLKALSRNIHSIAWAGGKHEAEQSATADRNHLSSELANAISERDEARKECERLRALTLNPGATLHGSTITEIAADRDLLASNSHVTFKERSMISLPRDTLPHRHDGESAVDFYNRVALVYDVHLVSCNECNYDKDCMACASGVSDLDATSHSCNCSDATPPGFGKQLRQLFEQARKDAENEQRQAR